MMAIRSKSESIAALGTIGDEAAVPALIEALSNGA